VVGVEVGEHDPAHVAGLDPQLAQLRPDLLLRSHRQTHREPEVRVPAREPAGLAGARGLAGVDHDHALGVLDHPHVDWQRAGPVAVGHRQHRAQRPRPHAAALALGHAHRAGADRVDAHQE
jgi:hypothetical protein